MYTIYHIIGVRSSLDRTYHALTSIDGICNWWTKADGIADKKDGIIGLMFGDTRMEMKVKELNKPYLVQWRCILGHPLWVDTQLDFSLEYDTKNQQTLLQFKHSNWKEDSTLFRHCTTKWAVFMLSLKDFLEKGKGNPHPYDIKIDYS